MNRSIQYHLSKTDVVSTLSYRLSRLYACMLSCFSHVQFCETLWTVACQAPLSVGFSRQEYWSGLPLPPPGDLPNPGVEPMSLMSPALAGRFLTTLAPLANIFRCCLKHLLYGQRFVTLYRRQGSRPSPRKRNAKRQNGCLRRPYKQL